MTTFVRLAKWCRSSAEGKSSTQSTSKEGTTQAEAAVKPPPAPKEAEPKPSEPAAASPPKPKVAAAGGAKKAAKAVAKPLPEAMAEDIIPKLTAYFENEKGISDVEILFDDNQVFEMLAGASTFALFYLLDVFWEDLVEFWIASDMRQFLFVIVHF